MHRSALIDGLRGLAVTAMVAFHFGYDLNHFGWIRQDLVGDWRWALARSLILGSFMALVGIGAALAETHLASRRRRLRRCWQVGLAAAAVSAVSLVMFPRSAIYFGVLHAIFLASLLLLFWRPPAWSAVLAGGAVVALGAVLRIPAFNHPALAWLGFMTYVPRTEDYVPLFPWLGLSLLAYGLCRMRLRRGALPEPAWTRLRRWRGLAWLGRHSLAVYLLHQPVLFAGFIGVGVLGASP